MKLEHADAGEQRQARPSGGGQRSLGHLTTLKGGADHSRAFFEGEERVVAIAQAATGEDDVTIVDIVDLEGGAGAFVAGRAVVNTTGEDRNAVAVKTEDVRASEVQADQVRAGLVEDVDRHVLE